MNQDTPNNKKLGIWRGFQNMLKRFWGKLQPASHIRKGAAWGLISLLTVFAVLRGLFIRPGFKGILDDLSGSLLMLILVFLFCLVIALAWKALSIFPGFIGRIGFIVMLAFIWALSDMGFPFPAALGLGLILGLVNAFLGGGIASILHKDFKYSRIIKKIFVLIAIFIPVALNTYLVIWMLSRGGESHLTALKPISQQIETLDSDNPSRPGPYEVKSLTYGSGTFKRRSEFGKEVDLKTDSVDATPFIKNNKGWKMKLRKWYWGFDFKEFPLNGRVWYPDGEGPFPLVLIVHGNHKMEEFSDPGYAYLGELLASRGFIFVSVDENFFNGSFFSGLRRENDGRGWLLLQHLKLWREWNQAEDNPFYQSVDMENIGLIGHSRGGEAAAIAGCFNRLRYYPEDAFVEFDFNFNIKAIISIAPSDGQYKPAGRPTPLENVNYLVFQGAHDADVSIFLGIRQYNRVKFTDGNYWFKASLYSYRSNHGQFNTVWGDNDWGKPMGFMLNRNSLLTGDEQRKISKVYISAFLEYALQGDISYIPLFRDHSRIADWLPEDIYINRFEDSNFQKVCDYEEDVDVLTASLNGTQITTNKLGVWREGDLSFRGGNTKQNNVVFIGWSHEAEKDQGRDFPSYTIDLSGNIAGDMSLTQDSLLVFTMAEADEKVPEPDEDDGDKDKEDNQEKADRSQEIKAEKKEPEQEEKEAETLDLSVELRDAEGNSVRLPLSQFKTLPPILRSRFTKLFEEKSIFGKSYEPTLQTFELPLSAFVDETTGFDPERLISIRFVFDRSPEGVIILDNIGFTH